MLNRDFAGTTAGVGKSFTQPAAIRKNVDLGDALANYQKGMDKRLSDQQRDALVTALQGGDEMEINNAAAAYDPAAFYNNMMKVKEATTQFDRQKELANINNAAAMERIKQTYSGKGGGNGFGNTQAGLALRVALNPDEYDENIREWSKNYLAGNSSSAMYDSAYQKTRGAKQAEAEFEKGKETEMVQDQKAAIDTLISDIANNKDLIGVYSPMRAAAARFSSGSIGYTPDELAMRGEIIRQAGEIQNSIIAKARAAGQTGINTMAEIRQATKGLDENSSADEMIGALRALKKANDRLEKRGSTTVQAQVDSDPLGLR